MTCIPLDGPGWDQLAANTDKLAFRFFGKPGSHQANLVLGFPIPNTTERGAYKDGAFGGTPLGREGEYLRWNADRLEYMVPTEFVMGYLVHETGQFVHNPNYWANTSTPAA